MIILPIILFIAIVIGLFWMIASVGKDISKGQDKIQDAWDDEIKSNHNERKND